jgi:NAD(P)-dependent dehydrogenase (short-subunit alcohol dehydrogenase family)
VNDLFDLSDRVAVVTGAGGGLGTAICAGLAAHGADVALIEPHEMVGPVLFLVSDAAAMVTGVLLPVDGGNLALNAGGTKD